MMSKAKTQLPKKLLEYTSVQDYSLYTHIDQAVWRYVMRISFPYFKKYAHESYVKGIEMVGIPMDKIPKIDEMDQKLDSFGWGAVSVKGFIPPIIFMEFLARKVLPIAVDIRTSKNITYTPAPDIIHEAAGHAPIIANKDYADYLSAYGEISQKAIESKYDAEQYEIVRELSVLKDNPNADPKILNKIENKFKNLSKKKTWLSEASELARMNWWTIEYGLVGDLTKPKIYGAGLLSSVSESVTSLTKNVKKIPLNKNCIKQPYNITEPQPQLFVTKDFKKLKTILLKYSKTMAFKTGGGQALEKAILSKHITTTVMDSGLQISGVIEKCILNKRQELAYMTYNGGTQLSFKDCQLEGHSKEFHSEGYGCAIGKVSAINKPLHNLDNEELISTGIIKNNYAEIKFVTGLTVSGFINDILKINKKPILINFKDASVKLDNKDLFKPEWGEYDLACGGKIISIYGGPADWEKFNNSTTNIDNKTYQSSNLTLDNVELNQLYEKVETLKIKKASNKDYLQILKTVYTSYPNEWLICMNIYEIIFNDSSLKDEITFLRNHLRKFKNNLQLSDAIKRGIELIENSN